MRIKIKTDPLRSAILFGRPVLFASQRIPREEVPESWYYYELRGSVRNAKKPVALSDHAYVNPIGSVLSPVPLKRADTISRRVNGQFLLLGETTTLRDYCWNNGLEYPFPNQTFAVRPASPEEAGIFYAQTPEQDTALGAIGHVRMDFGRSGKDFWHTWHPRGPEELNNTAFKAELQEVMDELRASVLKDYNAMTRYCESHGGKIDGGWVQNYGYIIETEGYRYCLRCNPVQGDYQNIGEDGFTEADHIRLRDALMRIQGKFLLSYNDDAFIRGLYDQPSIYLMETTRINNIKQRYDNGAQFPELLIANYDLQERSRVVPSQMTLFDWAGGEAIG